MAYTREIDNPALIQYIILYTLAEANRHVTYPQLIGLVLDNCNIEFPNFQLALSNLEQTKHVRRFSPDQNTTFYELLPKGQQANEFFKRDIPIYIRDVYKRQRLLSMHIKIFTDFMKNSSLKKCGSR